MSRQSKRRYGKYKQAAIRRATAVERYLVECKAIGADPRRMPTMILNRWGLGEGDIWHYIELRYSFRADAQPLCDYDGYCIANAIFYDADIGYPPFNVCEACLCLKIMKDLSE